VKEQQGKETADYAAVLLAQIVDAALPGQWFREFTFHESRNWRLDVACPARKLCIEVDSFVHRIRKRFLGDIEKHNALTFAGWHYLRCTPEQVRTGQALALVRAFVTKGD
jgi:very-short-patch-repair endonuclease